MCCVCVYIYICLSNQLEQRKLTLAKKTNTESKTDSRKKQTLRKRIDHFFLSKITNCLVHSFVFFLFVLCFSFVLLLLVLWFGSSVSSCFFLFFVFYVFFLCREPYILYVVVPLYIYIYKYQTPQISPNKAYWKAATVQLLHPNQPQPAWWHCKSSSKAWSLCFRHNFQDPPATPILDRADVTAFAVCA